MDLQQICEKVCALAKETAAFLKSQVDEIKATDVETKGLHDFVTYVDKNAEKRIVAALSQIFPDAGFIVEERTITSKEKEYNWVVDPLDGTTNFIHGLPCYSVSIALMKENEVILGVVFEANLGECFYAWKDSPAYLNGKEIKVSDRNTVADSLIATGFPYFDFTSLEKYIQLFSYFIRTSHGIRRLGSAAVDLAYVACGRFEGFFEYSLNPWDVAAGAFIVQRAGGKVSDFTGGDNYIFGKQIVASNYNISEEFMGIIQKVYTGDASLQ
jgi:myo-inositol-1(or 4)-monophosphatase